ncbi:NADPH-dependent FMN reductase [Streptomyces sp. NPDC001083]|uniref:NADPH-dependent FMN reductase n=1 Tax=Streptomyces sp. NPDC001083 TaxID=3364545 RepID=UPI003676B464
MANKNALDYVYQEWNDKAAGIISYGGWVAGARAAEALRLVLAELQVATVRPSPPSRHTPRSTPVPSSPRRVSTPQWATCSTR